MKILFLHNNFPGQYRRLINFLKDDPLVEDMIAVTLETNQQKFPLKKVLYKPHRPVTKGIHPAVVSFESAVINAQNVFQKLVSVKQSGWKPDIICGHSGWGPTMFLRELWPDTRMLTYYEWWYNSTGADTDFLRREPAPYDERVRMQMKNAPFLADLSIMDWGICPTRFQHSQFPAMFRDKIELLHDGVDTDFMCPDRSDTLTIGDKTFRAGDEIVTYATRGMEPYRGFPQFMEAVAKLQKRRPNMQTIVVGRDRVAYGSKRSDGKTYKEHALETLDLDLSRIHFLDLVPLEKLRTVFRISSVHVYLTVPFVLSWSMIEAMSTGVLLLGSDTDPIREMIEDGKNGLLVDFFDSDKIAARMEEALAGQQKFVPLRAAARRTVLERYAMKHLLPCHRQLMVDVASGAKTCR
ncbi:glycosyltransferase [Afifella sp. JA880]|uniref:glycosyltransferase n=1 Tax=Afifella sp. JA880 TaxID=2975280 RepID=UPI0021BA7D08|nr:glycosyltransferase [Afifella sp. JA880]MCT8268919.1 glycosyltransferase [Afifella sp. JA880]